MQVIHIFEHIAFHSSRYSNIINQACGNRQSTSASVLGGREREVILHLKWITYSQSPTPPACGQTGTPNLKWFHNQERKNVSRENQSRGWIRANGPEDLRQVHRKQMAF